MATKYVSTTKLQYFKTKIENLFAKKTDLAKVAISGSYNDLSNKPTIPSVGNGTITITQNGTSKGIFTTNQSGNTTIELTDNNTNTWRPVVDNLTSTDIDSSLSANQGKVLKALIDGKAASSHTHNYAGSTSAGGVAIIANNLLYCRATIGDTNSYPYHRILMTNVQTGSWVDCSGVFEITAGYQGGGYGIFKVDLRTNNVSNRDTATAEIKWLVRLGFAENQLVAALKNTSSNSYLDVYYKSGGTYASVVINKLYCGIRGDIGETYTMVNSSQAGNNGTATEAYASITTSTTSPRSYTNIITAVDSASVSYAKSAGKTTEVTLSTSKWSNNSQTVTLTGMTASKYPIVDVKINTTAIADIQSIQNEFGKIIHAVTGTNQITFYCSSVPTKNLTILVKEV